MKKYILMSQKARDVFKSLIAQSDPDGCRVWTGDAFDNGYGNAGIGPAHIVSFVLANGPFAQGLYVCHTCDNKLCVNPKHLWLGTPKQNMEDKKAKGRCGVSTPNKTLNITDDIVRDIRSMKRKRARVWAKELGCSPLWVVAIRNRRAYKHIE